MTPEQFKTLHEVLKASTESVNAYWTLYSTVALALLGYVFAAKGPIEYRAVRWVLACVFAVYAYCNRHALNREQQKLCAVSEYVVGELRKHPETTQLAQSFDYYGPAKNITLVHLVLDIAVIAFVLKAAAIKGKKATSSA